MMVTIWVQSVYMTVFKCMSIKVITSAASAYRKSDIWHTGQADIRHSNGVEVPPLEPVTSILSMSF